MNLNSSYKIVTGGNNGQLQTERASTSEELLTSYNQPHYLSQVEKIRTSSPTEDSQSTDHGLQMNTNFRTDHFDSSDKLHMNNFDQSREQLENTRENFDNFGFQIRNSADNIENRAEVTEKFGSELDNPEKVRSSSEKFDSKLEIFGGNFQRRNESRLSSQNEIDSPLQATETLQASDGIPVTDVIQATGETRLQSVERFSRASKSSSIESSQNRNERRAMTAANGKENRSTSETKRFGHNFKLFVN